MSKKRIIIILLIIALILGGGALYLFYAKKLPSIPFLTPSEQPAQEVPSLGGEALGEEKLKRISGEGAVSPVLTQDGAHVRYVGKRGEIHDVGFDGSLIKKTPFTPLQNLIKILWSSNRSSFATIYADPSGKKMFYYDLEKKQMSPYASTIRALAVSSEENKIIYHSLDGLVDTPLIAIADLDGKNARTVLQSRVRGVDLAWITKDEAAMSTTPSGLSPNMLWIVNTTSRKLSSVLSDRYGLTTQWAPSGNQFLFSSTNTQGKDLSLSLSNKNGTTINELAIATLPEKCVFSRDEKSVFCAAPSTTPNLVWPDDYYKKMYTTQEQIVRIDLATEKKDVVYEFPNALFDASELILSPNEDRLVFINRKDGELYSLMLK